VFPYVGEQDYKSYVGEDDPYYQNYATLGNSPYAVIDSSPTSWRLCNSSKAA
jgi:hypothetical protein